ncbi:MAG: DUF4268 domain-containing protein [Deltaproteobacteria bacterium]|nr:DUF4268 domain-containing protein [Deltaproteobacteria bacterium]
MKPVLGKLTRVDPRTVWKHEALDFTPWLEEHIEELGEALGMDLEVTARESAVGSFAVDLLAKDLGSNRTVIIENQLAQTDHSHLGQLITYAAGLEAQVVIWVSPDFRDEHHAALDWLNRGEASVAYFGVVLELLQVDDSRPAVNLRVVSSPSTWTREAGSSGPSGEVSEKRVAYREFFQRLIDELREKHKFTNAKAGQPQNWYSFPTGTGGFLYSVSFASGGKVRAELYIDLGDRDRNIGAFERLQADKPALVTAFGEPLEFERLDGKRACRVACYRPGSIDDSEESLEGYHQWCVDRLLRFKKVIGPRLPGLAEASAKPAALE